MPTLSSMTTAVLQRVRMRLRRRVRVLLAPLLVVTVLGVAVADDQGDDKYDDDRRGGRSYAIGLWGDLPYSAGQSLVGVPNLIADMNAQQLKFTVHDGDLKAGSSRCDEVVYTQSLAYFNALKAPAMFTPGDNDWADCDRVSNGAYSSRERLDYERALFFSTPYSMGQQRMRQEVQQGNLCLGVAGYVPCAENRRWTVGRVVYVTLNVTGSCNNLCDTAPDVAEYTARNLANLRWLQESFAYAKERNAVAVMLVSQANPGWDESDPTRAPVRNPRTLAQTDGQPDGFVEFLTALRNEVIAFKRPVAYVHGDSHYYRVDKPFQDSAGRRLENFTRVETFGNNPANGNNDVQWIKVKVDPRSREVFSYEAMIVPGNRVAVPAP
jgi:hypothetical protein